MLYKPETSLLLHLSYHFVIAYPFFFLLSKKKKKKKKEYRL